ncbi:sterol-binding domain-containing protein [Amylibacter ulvae]|uniref:Sterol-binding domain-containing protein n=1 Tax=Paramylibacter ulvae TaxID=1651968 RepID=A0ABQ3D793_9RHOB|nr:SCP2 sterol-binding domain-containing protein [Amylibacter ulvae]GHA62448.1 sterol-binding domain-containing protein [Amylibacter ulvae]
MSDVINTAVTAINEKLDGEGFDGSIKIVVDGEGSLIINESGAVASDDDAECTMTADAETLAGIMTGEVNATSAFMSGKLAVDGDMSQAMKLGTILG